MGIEPTTSAWKAEVLPLNYTRIIRTTIIISNKQYFSTGNLKNRQIFISFIYLLS